jgi:hypothetical protein
MGQISLLQEKLIWLMLVDICLNQIDQLTIPYIWKILKVFFFVILVSYDNLNFIRPDSILLFVPERCSLSETHYISSKIFNFALRL